MRLRHRQQENGIWKPEVILTKASGIDFLLNRIGSSDARQTVDYVETIGHDYLDENLEYI